MPNPYEQGKFLYHYTTLQTACAKIIPSGRFLPSPLGRVKDPVEQKLRIALGPVEPPTEMPTSTAEEQQAFKAAWDRRKYWMHADESFGMHQGTFWSRILEDLRVASLTEDRAHADETATTHLREPGWAHPRLWEHYAERHTGVCLVLNREAFISQYEVQAASIAERATGTPSHAHHGSVNYERARLETIYVAREELAEYSTEDFYFGDLYKLSAAGRGRHWDKLVFTKMRDWDSECEYRLALFIPSDWEGPAHLDPALDPTMYPEPWYGLPLHDSLSGVILGANADEWTVPAVVGALDRFAPHIVPESLPPLWRMQWHTDDEGEPDLEEVPPR